MPLVVYPAGYRRQTPDRGKPVSAQALRPADASCETTAVTMGSVREPAPRGGCFSSEEPDSCSHFAVRPPARRRDAELGLIADGSLLIDGQRIDEVGSTRRIENLSKTRHARLCRSGQGRRSGFRRQPHPTGCRCPIRVRSLARWTRSTRFTCRHALPRAPTAPHCASADCGRGPGRTAWRPAEPRPSRSAWGWRGGRATRLGDYAPFSPSTTTRSGSPR